LQDFSSVAEKTGTYTAMDYADIMEHLVKRWRVAERNDLTGEVRSSRILASTHVCVLLPVLPVLPSTAPHHT
jgi:acyl-[acyl-carrier-protein] desaturase